MLSKTKRLILAGVSMTMGLSLAAGVYFTSQNIGDAFRGVATGAHVVDGSINFLPQNKVVDGNTITIRGATQTGYPIICVIENSSGSVANDALGNFVNGTTVNFYQEDGSTQFAFQNINTFYINKKSGDNTQLNFRLNYTTKGTAKSSNYTSFSNDLTSKTLTFTGSSYLGTTDLIMTCTSSSGYLSEVTELGFTYTCDNRVIESIAVTTAPTKTSYYIGESFNSAGIVVTGYYDNGDTVDVTSECTYSPTKMTAETTYVVVNYNSLSTTQPVTVSEPSYPGTYRYASSYYTYTIELSGEQNDKSGNGVYTFRYNNVDYTMHFTWVVDNSSIVFTKNKQEGDSDYDSGYQRLFTTNGSYNTTNTGSFVGTSLKIYTCSETLQISTVKTLVRI